MDDQLPWHVRDNELVTRFPENSSHVVVHEFDGPDPSLPPRLERWETETQRIGCGGQGEVFLQKCHTTSGLNTLRAVKILPLRDGSKHRKSRSARELEVIFRFSRKRYTRHFVKSLGWYRVKDGARLCIAMGYHAKGDLQTYLDNYPCLLEEECREIIRQVVEGLYIMHREGFAHRDVKPSNVLIQQCPSDGERDVWWVKLIDFGFSRELESTLTGSATVCGTMAYMAPEILKRFRGLEQRHSPMAVDYPAADMWAVGVMAFRILAGMDPFPNLPDVLKYCNHSEFFPFLRCVIVG